MLSLTLREHKIQAFENKLLRKISGPERDEVNSLGYYIMRNFMIYTGHPVLLG
jgi:hypothetical protein